MQQWVFLSVFFVYIVPSSGPTNISALATTSTSMLVRWNDIPEADRNGFILGYKVSISTTDLAVLSLLAFSCAILQRPDLKHCTPPHLIALSFFQFDPESLPADSTIVEDSLVNIFFQSSFLLLSPPHFPFFKSILCLILIQGSHPIYRNKCQLITLS